VTLGKPSVPYTTSASVLIKQRNSNATVNQPIDTPNPSFHAFLFCFNKIKSLLLPKHLLVVGPASVASVSTLVLWCVGRVDREPLRSSSVVTMRLSCTGMALDLRHCRDPTFTGRGHCWDCLSIPGTLTLTLDCVVDYERGLTTDFRVGTQSAVHFVTTVTNSRKKKFPEGKEQSHHRGPDAGPSSRTCLRAAISSPESAWLKVLATGGLSFVT
jgi:hypothetical protein